MELTVGCEAELDDGEDELDRADGEDPVDCHFDSAFDSVAGVLEVEVGDSGGFVL